MYAYLFEIVFIFIIFDYVMRGYRCVGEYVCVCERPEVDPTGAGVTGSCKLAMAFGNQTRVHCKIILHS